jgi:hypothetical protein
MIKNRDFVVPVSWNMIWFPVRITKRLRHSTKNLKNLRTAITDDNICNAFVLTDISDARESKSVLHNQEHCVALLSREV